MDRLCGEGIVNWKKSSFDICYPDEIIQLIFFELQDPSHFILISKRFYEFSQDPYVRAHYFLTRYGRIQAMYWALGRGKVMNQKVLDVR
jgi:hypothetical protein